MDSNNSSQNEIIVNNEEKSDSNNASIIMNIINETIESIEVPLNTNQLQLESSPSLQMKCNINVMSDETDVNEDSIDDNNSDQNDSDVNQTNTESVKDMRHQYSKEQLIAISKLSLARMRPQCLDNSFNNPSNGLWDPEKWMSSRSPGNNSVINSSVKYNYNKRERTTDGNENVSKKANNDPQQKIIEEEKDNIILSPQRGSFGTGCHVSTTTFVSNKTVAEVRSRDHHQHQERPKNDESNEGSHRSNSISNQRRVGTGRIIPKERERTNDWTDRSYERDRNFDRSENRDNNKSDEYNERRKSRLSYDSRRGITTNSNRNNRYENGRYRENFRQYKEEEEPEWFSGGPTSKHETIELKGFDDEPEDKKSSKDGINDTSDDKTHYRQNTDNDFESNNNQRLPQKDNNSSTNTNTNTIDLNESKSELKDRENTEKSDDFDVNNMFKIDDFFSDVDETQDSQQFSPMDGISSTAATDCDKSGKSRFKQWFKESPITTQLAQFNDNAENDGIIKNAFKDKHLADNDYRSNAFTQSSMTSTYQQSIPKSSETNNEKNIFDLLQGANRMMSFEHLIDQKEHKSFDPSKARNVCEIEASLKKLEIDHKSDGKQLNDKIAFEKLINELGKKSLTNTPFCENINNMAVKQSEAMILPTSSSNIIIPKEQQKPRSAPTILELLKEDQNQDAFEALAHSQVKYWNKESNHSSISQLNNSSVQMFNNINNVTNYSNTAMPSHNWHNTTQSLINPMNTRIPSPQELTDHTQTLLRNALIQRRNDESNKSIKTQSIAENIRNSTPIKGMNNTKYSAFTPTSVILKMHSEKAKSGASFDDMTGDQTSQQKFITEQGLLNTNKLNMNSPRPIVKSNNPFRGQQQAMHSNIMNSHVSPQTNTFQFNTNSENSFKFLDSQQQQMLVQQQLQQQSLQSSQVPKVRAHNSSSMPSVIQSIGSPLNLSTLNSGVMFRSSTLSPNANNNNMQTQNQSIRNMNQSLNSSNIRQNSMNQLQQISNLMTFQQQRQQQQQQQPQHSAPNESRQIQYSRAMPSMNIPPMYKTSNSANNQTFSNSMNSSGSIGMSGQSIPQTISRSDNNQFSVFNNQMDRNEQLKSSIATTYQQSRPQNNTFMSSGNVHSRHLGQWFGNEMLNQKLANMPSVPLQNALTLEDIERPKPK